MTSAQSVCDSELSAELERVCETTDQCDAPATFMVWCDHHVLGCDYTGYRCDIHRNLLELETRREVDRINRGQKYECFNCNTPIKGGALSDHFRYLRL